MNYYVNTHVDYITCQEEFVPLWGLCPELRTWEGVAELLILAFDRYALESLLVLTFFA